MYKLVKNEKGNKTSEPIMLLNKPEEAFKKLNKNSLKILKTLAKKPMYATELSKELGIHEQKIYYYLNSLKQGGLVKVIREETRRGAVKKYFSPTANAFGFELKKRAIKEENDEKFVSFFQEFISSGLFDGSIVVSAAFEHGPYLTSARDGHYATQLGFFLGKYCDLPKKFVVKLDTEVKAEHKENRNLILIGGPTVNIITSELNKKLKIKFKWDKKWKIFSEFTGKEYRDEEVALIAKITNPWNKDKKIILLSGLRFEGTKTSIIAITQHFNKLLKKYNQGKEFYCVVKGLDRDGDGKTDDVKIIEMYSE